MSNTGGAIVGGRKVTVLGETENGGLEVDGKLFVNGIEVFPSPSGLNPNFSPPVPQLSHGFSIGDVIYYDSVTLQFELGRANNPATSSVLGVVIEIEDSDTFIYQTSGFANLSGYTPNEQYFLSEVTPGGVTVDAPVNTYVIVPVFQCHTPTMVYINFNSGTQAAT